MRTKNTTDNPFVCFLLFVILLNCNTKSHAQINTFNQVYDFSSGADGALNLVLVADGYVLIGNGWAPEYSWWESFKFLKIDFEGNIIWQRVYGQEGIAYFGTPGSAITTQDGLITFVGNRHEGENSDILLVKINPETGDTIFTKQYGDSTHFEYPYRVKEFSNGDLLIIYDDVDSEYGPHLLKLRSDGEIIWQKIVGGVGEISSVELQIDEEDHFLFINAKNKYCTGGYFIREFDSSGTLLSEIEKDAGCILGGMKSAIGGYIGLGQNLPAHPENTFTFRANNAGNILWKWDSSIDLDTVWNEILGMHYNEELPNGDMYVFGYYAYLYDGQPYRGIVSKVNADGEPYWERYYMAENPDYSYSLLADMVIAPDSGLLFVGQGYANDIGLGQNFWALKLDSMGCLIPGCDTIEVSEPIDTTGEDTIIIDTLILIQEIPSPFQNILIYPNPIYNEALVQIEMENMDEMIKQDFYYLILDMYGREIRKEQIKSDALKINGNKISFAFQREKIASGFYMLQIKSGNDILGTRKIVFK